MAGCHGCGATLPPSMGGRPRKWCSERCRKNQYDLECVECGARVDGTTPGRNGDEPRCRPCATADATVWTREAIVLAIQEWADDNGGVPPSAVDAQRTHHLDPHALPSLNHVQYRFGKFNDAIRAAGFEPHSCGPVGGFTRPTDAQRREMVRRYKRGESSVAIAADFRVNPKTVIRWVRRAGVPVRPSMAQRAA